eukprot:1464145-Pleurochrysis_carterae.AAC.1
MGHLHWRCSDSEPRAASILSHKESLKASDAGEARQPLLRDHQRGGAAGCVREVGTHHCEPVRVREDEWLAHHCHQAEHEPVGGEGYE